MKKALKYLDESFEEIILIALLVVITGCIFLNVFMRYVLGNALSWPEELSRYCFVYSGMLSTGYCVKKGGSFRVDILYAKFPRAIKIAVEYMAMLFLLFLYAYMAYSSIHLIATTTNVSTAMQIPMQYIYAAIPIGMTLGVLRSIQCIYQFTKKVLKGEAMGKEIVE